jgi:cytochrome P450
LALDAGVDSRPTIEFDHTVALPRAVHLALGKTFRDTCPIGWSSAHGGVWYVSRYDLVKQIGRDVTNYTAVDGVSIPGHKFSFPILPNQVDPPLHGYYREALQRFVSPGAIKAFEGDVRQIVVESMQPILAKRGGDVVNEFAINVPTRAAALALGYSDAQTLALHHLFTEMTEAAVHADEERKSKAMDGIVSCLSEVYEECASGKGSNVVVNSLMRPAPNGKSFSKEEILGMLSGVTIGAIDTSKHSIVHAMYFLATDQDSWSELKANKDLVPAAVEEVLRLASVGHFVARTVTQDHEVEGVLLRKGERVILVNGWANRDERVFTNPDKLDLHRGPNHHVGFGHGIHSCLGMHLARLELKIALEEIIDRMPHFSLVEPVPSPRSIGSAIWGHDYLNITLN